MPEIQLFQNLILKIQGQGHGPGQNCGPHLSPIVQFTWSLSISRQSDHFVLRYSKLNIWPWKFEVKVLAKVKTDHHTWGLKFNWYFCFLFRGHGTILGWDTANYILDVENFKVKVTAFAKLYSSTSANNSISAGVYYKLYKKFCLNIGKSCCADVISQTLRTQSNRLIYRLWSHHVSKSLQPPAAVATAAYEPIQGDYLKRVTSYPGQ